MTAYIPKNLSLQQPPTGVECQDATGHFSNI